jgi:hypothetical protein
VGNELVNAGEGRRVGVSAGPPGYSNRLEGTDDVLAGELAHGRVATPERFEASYPP